MKSSLDPHVARLYDISHYLEEALDKNDMTEVARQIRRLVLAYKNFPIWEQKQEYWENMLCISCLKKENTP